MIKEVYYYLTRKYWDWFGPDDDFPGCRLAKDIKWTLQKIFKGYNDPDLWNLDSHLAKVILKRLKAYKQMGRDSYPPPDAPGNTEIKDENDWERVLDAMIEGFEAHIFEINDFEDKFNLDRCLLRQKKINHGMSLFGKYFGYLWD